VNAKNFKKLQQLIQNKLTQGVLLGKPVDANRLNLNTLNLKAYIPVINEVA